MPGSGGRVVVMVVVCMSCWVALGTAAPAGYRAESLSGASGGVSALAYAADGTLYLTEAGSSVLTVIAPDGARTQLPIVGASLVSVGGMCVAPDGQSVLITDNKRWGDGLGDLYAVDVSTGQASTLIDGMDSIEDVAVRSTGEVFVTDAVGMGAGTVCQVVRDGGGFSATPVVTGLEYAAGLAFDAAGDLVFQQADASFSGEVYRLPISEGAGGLSFGSPELLAGGLAAAFDLAVDGEGDVFVSGAGGVHELDRGPGGEFLGTASVFDAHGFSTEIAFVCGQDAFEPYAGWGGGHLTFVPEYSNPDLVDVTPLPGPAVLALLLAAAPAALTRRRRSR